MGGKQDSHALLLQPQENFQQLLAGNGVQPAGGLIQKQQLGMVRKSQRQQEFDLHALAELPQALALIQRKAPQIIPVGGIIPAGIEGGRHAGDLSDPAALIVAGAPRRVADLLLDPLFILGKGQPKVADLPGIGVDQPQDGFESGGFTGAIAADKAHNAACLQ